MNSKRKLLENEKKNGKEQNAKSLLETMNQILHPAHVIHLIKKIWGHANTSNLKGTTLTQKM